MTGLRRLLALGAVLACLAPAPALAEGVNTATGAFVTQETDLRMPGLGVGFELQRTYNSNAPRPDADLSAPLGPRWRTSFEASVLEDAAGNVLVTGTDGQQAVYLKNGANYLPPAGVHAELTYDSGAFTLTTRDGNKALFDEATGHVTAMTDRYDHGLSFTYTSGRLTSVTDEAGREVEFAYDDVGGYDRLVSVTLPDEREVTYSYAGGGDHPLQTVTDATGAETTYAYTDDERQFLDSITDANEHVVVANSYDDLDRVVAQEDGLEQPTTFAWDDSNPTIEVTTTRPDGAEYVDSYQGLLLLGTTDPLGEDRTYGYDVALNRTSVTDGRRVVTEMAHDSDGNLTESGLPVAALSETHTYNSLNLPTSSTDARGETTSYTWDGTQLTSVTYPDGEVSTRAYNGNNQLQTATDQRGNVVTYAYDADLNRTSATTEEGRVSGWGYDGSGRVITATDGNGGLTTYEYDEADRLVSMTDPLERVTTYEYDAVGNLVKVTDPAEGETTTVYDELDRPVSVTDAEGRTATTDYDEVGNVVSVTTPTGDETTFAYDLAGQRTTAVTANGNEPGADPADFTWQYGYDQIGNRVSVEDPLGGTTTTTYDDLSRPVTIEDPLGRTTTTGYDAVGRLVSVNDPNDDETTTTYDEVGRPLVTTSPEGRTTTRAYDEAGNLISITDGLGNTASFTYDDDGFLASSVDPRGNEPGADPDDFRTTYARDSAGQVTEVEDPLGHTVTSGYDDAGNTLTVTDPNGHTTSYAYDDLDRVSSVTRPGSEVTSFTYDGVGNALTRTDARAKTTAFGYDDADRLISTTLPTGEETSFSYDAEGQAVGVVTGRGNASLTPAAGTITRGYDPLGRLTGIDYGDATPDVDMTYDAAGRLIQMDDGPGTETYAYDDAGRLQSVTRGSDVLGYAYDGDGLITTRTQPGSVTIGATYDDAGRIDSVTAGGVITSYEYDAAGNLTGTALPAGTGYSTARTFDGAGRLTAVENGNGAVLSRFAQTLDPAGNPIRIDTTRGGATTSQAFDYDPADRLNVWCPGATDCVSPSAYVAFDYDAVGNRSAQVRAGVPDPGTTTYAYSDSNRLTSSTIGGVTTTYAHDADGNQTQAGATDMAYDLADRMTSIDDGTSATSFLYDGAGHRLRATTSSAQVRYLWDPQNANAELVLERDASNALIRRHTHGIGGAPLAMSDGSATYYLLPDLMGSTADLINSSGAAQARYAYEPFGLATETQLVGGAPANPVRFTGEYQDPSGQLHLRARQYDPATGRFTGVDPIDDNSATSRFAYVGNRPGVLIDPSGEFGIPSVGDLRAGASHLREFNDGLMDGTLDLGRDAVRGAWDNRNVNLLDAGRRLVHACDDIYAAGGSVLACVDRMNYGRQIKNTAQQAGRLAANGCWNELGRLVGPDIVLALVPGGAAIRAGGGQVRVGAGTARAARRYVDLTKGGSIRNIGTDATRQEFSDILAGNGWASRVSQDRAVQIFEKDGARYVLRSNADSYSGWTADYYAEGASRVTLKLRLGYRS